MSRDKWSAASAAFLIGLMLVLPTTSASAAAPSGWVIGPPDWHFYMQVNNMTWEQAEAFAQTQGGHLVAINSLEEQSWLSTTFTDPNLWIGFGRDIDGSWKWTSGEPVTYTNWAPGEPNNASSGENWAVMNWLTSAGAQTWQWNDLGTGSPEYLETTSSIIEVAESPATGGNYPRIGIEYTGGDNIPYAHLWDKVVGEWAPGKTITVEVDRPGQAPVLLGTWQTVTYDAEHGYGGFNLVVKPKTATSDPPRTEWSPGADPDLEFHFLPGDTVAISDEVTVRSLTLGIGDIDVRDDGTLEGDCAPGMGAAWGETGSLLVSKWQQAPVTVPCAPDGTFSTDAFKQDMSHPQAFTFQQRSDLASGWTGSYVSYTWAWNPPTFTVEVNDDAFYGGNWVPDSSVDVYVNDTLLSSVLVDSNGVVQEEYEGVYDFQTYDVVRVEDSDDPAISKELVLTPLEVTAFDVVAGTLSGICTTDLGEVFVRDSAGYWDLYPCQGTGTIGSFDASGFPIVGWENGGVHQTDIDGDSLAWTWGPPPTILYAEGSFAFGAGGSTIITFTLSDTFSSEVGDYCNVDAAHPVTFALEAWGSLDPEGSPPTENLAISPSTLTFTECWVGQQVTFGSDVADWYWVHAEVDWGSYHGNAQFYAEGFDLQVMGPGYDFTGFFSPVDNPDTVNTVKAGQAIPVKFSLGGDFGLDIITVGSANMTCETGDLDAVEETVAAGGSSLSYDALTDTYTYIWKTNKGWGGTCRQLNVTLDDGSSHLANFYLRK